MLELLQARAPSKHKLLLPIHTYDTTYNTATTSYSTRSLCSVLPREAPSVAAVTVFNLFACLCVCLLILRGT
jgi:hypothetical protein